MSVSENHAHETCEAPDEQAFERAAGLFKALASPLRLALLHEITQGPKCVHELVETLKISQPLASQHLKTLRDEHLVCGVRHGREMKYEITDTHITHIVADAFEHTKEAPHDHSDAPTS